jgi:hypothetical protein
MTIVEVDLLAPLAAKIQETCPERRSDVSPSYGACSAASSLDLFAHSIPYVLIVAKILSLSVSDARQSRPRSKLTVADHDLLRFLC